MAEIKGGGHSDASIRQHVRADDKIPVYYEVLASGDSSGTVAAWETMFDELEPKAEENPRLYEMLFDINQKLNILINHMAERSGFNIPEAREVNISAGGLRFVSEKPFPEGERLLIRTFLSTHGQVVRLKCEVLRSVERHGGFEVAVKFIDLDEATREKIIKYIFVRQRQILRLEKKP